jgi:hypothetical protein
MQNTPQKRKVLGFSTQSYPTFGRGVFNEANPPKTVLGSPYYWWFMFLRLNEDYKKTVDAKGAGKCAALYKDFGDIYSVDFKTWWNTHATYFAEKRNGYSMAIATKLEELAPFGNSEVINLVVPLNWSQRSLKKKFTQLILSKLEKGKRGVSVEASNATYRLSGKWHIEAMRSAYNVYTLRKTLVEGKKLPLADIAIKAELQIAKNMQLGKKTKLTSDMRRVATIIANRHYKRAELFIKAAASSSFPYSK